MQSHSNNSIGSLTNPLPNNVIVDVLNVASLRTKLVLLSIILAVFLIFILLHLVRESMCLRHLSVGILHLLHLYMLHHILLPTAKFLSGACIYHPAGLSVLQLAIKGLHGVPHWVVLCVGSSSMALNIIFVCSPQISLTLSILNPILIFSTLILFLRYFASVDPGVISRGRPFIQLYIIQLYLADIRVRHVSILNLNSWLLLIWPIINIHGALFIILLARIINVTFLQVFYVLDTFMATCVYHGVLSVTIFGIIDLVNK